MPPSAAFVRLVVAAVLVFSWPGLVPGSPVGAHAEEAAAIVGFERGNPAYDVWVEPGTPRDQLGLPETLRAVCPLPAPEGEGFRQTAPVADEEGDFDYYWYGYVAPRGADALYASGQPVVYTIYYAEGREAYRLHGTYDGADEGFYACDKQGTITGRVADIPVAWRGVYRAAEEGTYTLTAQVAGFDYTGEAPTAQATVKSQDAAPPCEDGCGGEGCTLGDGLALHEGPDAATGGDGVAAAPEGDSASGPSLYGDGISIMPLSLEDDGTDAYANDRAQDAWMYEQASTINTPHYINWQYGNTTVLPGHWLDYVNTIWHNKGVNQFEWTPASEIDAWSDWAWGGQGVGNGGAANLANNNTTVTPQNNPLCIPTSTGTGASAATPRVFTVYSGEQLRWALQDSTNPIASSGSFCTVRLGADINLNGMQFDWGVVNRAVGLGTNTAVTTTVFELDGDGFSIYNMGIFLPRLTSTDSNARQVSTGLFNSTPDLWNPTTCAAGNGATRNFRNLSMVTCKVVHMHGGGNDGVSDSTRTVSSSTSVLGSHLYQQGTVVDVHVYDSLVFGIRAHHPTTEQPYNWNGGNGAVSSIGTQLFMSSLAGAQQFVVAGGYRPPLSAEITQCSVEGGYVYGREHTVAFMRGIVCGTVSNSYATDNLVCGTAAHSATFMSCTARTTATGDSVEIRNCFSSGETYGSLMVGGFAAYYDPTSITNCYASGKLEGYRYLAGFYIPNNSDNGVAVERCYSTTLVGLRTEPSLQGGFIADMYNAFDPSITPRTRTGFSIRDVYAAGEVGNYDVDMADPAPVTAGTGANFTVLRGGVGGFASMRQDLSRIITNTSTGSDIPNDRIQYCYYDKQTTAMREWTVGTDRDYMAPTGTNANTAYNGVRGCLTSDTEKAGTGLASGKFGPIDDPGFRGFRNNALWDYQEQHYPQLLAFSGANTNPYNATTNPGGGWRQDDLDKVKAWSKASTATVFLDTWDKGYRWDTDVSSNTASQNNGVRTDTTEPWSNPTNTYRTGGQNHLGGTYSYDTVRDIISDFDVTKVPENNTAWKKLISDGGNNHGAPSWVTGINEGRDSTLHVAIENATGEGHVSIEHPGLDWYEVVETHGVMEGHRPLRVIAYMSVHAGDDATITQGDLYDHRPDVELTMMDALADDLVVGMREDNNARIEEVNETNRNLAPPQTPYENTLWLAPYSDYDMTWSRAIEQPYPRETENQEPEPIIDDLTIDPAVNDLDASDKYYNAFTDWTNYSVSHKAWVNTEIWRAERGPSGDYEYFVDADGNTLASDRDPITDEVLLVEKDRIGVVGPGTNSNTTIDEQMWNGDLPIYTGYASEQKYIIRYFWVLEDGRYRYDEKIVTVTPPDYDLDVNVYNMRDGSENEKALKPAAAPDLGADTGYTYPGTTMQSASAPENPQATNMAGAWKKANEGIKVQKIELVMTDKAGNEVGRGEVEGESLVEGAELEIPVSYYYATTSTEGGITRTVMERAEVTVVYTVEKDDEGGYYLHFNKIANPPADEAAGVQLNKDDISGDIDEAYLNDIGHNIVVNLYVDEINTLTIYKHLTDPDDPDTLMPAGREETFVFRVEYFGDGDDPTPAAQQTMFAVITIPADGSTSGQATFTDMPTGWYTVTELDSNWTYNLWSGPSGPLQADHADRTPAAVVGERSVGLWAEDSDGIFTFRNWRDDVPWVHDKARVTNEMPPVSDY